ncbi:MAG TPA: IS5 family transposase [Phototrophicaceae bacterium]|nr:IS5 family transposase [Phototrophicaceae bacterium]
MLSKDIIKEHILPHLSQGKRGARCKVDYYQIVKAIFHKLKTACQWRELPMYEFFRETAYSWQSIYYHFNKWAKDGSWQGLWIALLKKYRFCIDLSSMQLDGSHTLVKNGGACVGYQKRKKANTTNLLFLADNQGLMLACSEPISGEHNDLYQIQRCFDELCLLLQQAEISLEGVFMNADAGFDCKQLRKQCAQKRILANIFINIRNSKENVTEHYFDQQLYKKRVVIEQANAWLDSFKTLLIRFEVLTQTWIAFHLMAFSLLFLRRIIKLNKL